MKLKRETIQELNNILKEEFNSELNSSDLEKFAYSLAGYFDLLEKINSRNDVRK